MRASDPEYPRPSSETVSRVMRGNRKTESKPEARLRRELHSRGLRYLKNSPIRTPIGIVRPDLTFRGAKLAVFMDGCFWHACPLHGTTPRSNQGYWEPKLRRNQERDRLVNDALASDGWLVLRVWEHEAVSDAAAKIQELLVGGGQPRAHMSRESESRARREPTIRELTRLRPATGSPASLDSRKASGGRELARPIHLPPFEGG